MDALNEILQKIDQPLNFAFRDNYKNLSNIKDLGRTLITLLSKLDSFAASFGREEINHEIGALREIFSDYDRQKLELKKEKLKTPSKSSKNSKPSSIFEHIRSRTECRSKNH